MSRGSVQVTDVYRRLIGRLSTCRTAATVNFPRALIKNDHSFEGHPNGDVVRPKFCSAFMATRSTSAERKMPMLCSRWGKRPITLRLISKTCTDEVQAEVESRQSRFSPAFPEIMVIKWRQSLYKNTPPEGRQWSVPQ